MSSLPLPPSPAALAQRLPPAGPADTLGRALPEPPLGGNRVDLLDTPALRARALATVVDGACDHLNVDLAVAAGDDAGLLLEALAHRAAQGLAVNLLHDADAPHPGALAALRARGANPSPREPARRRLLVADGRVALVGDAHAGADAPLLRIEGPAVQRLQRVFAAHWQRRAMAAMRPARFFPPLPVAGTQRVAVAADEAARRGDGATAALVAALAVARQRVIASTGGRAPEPRVAAALAEAAGRGLRVELLLPGEADPRRARGATWPHYRPLLAAGARLYERRDGDAGETVVIDGLWTSVAAGPALPEAAAAAGRADIVVIDDGFARPAESRLRLALAVARPVPDAGWVDTPWWRRWSAALGRQERLR